MMTDQPVYLHDGAVAVRFPREQDAPAMWAALRESADHAGQWLPRLNGITSAADVRAHIKSHARERALGRNHFFVTVEHPDGAVLGGCGLTRLAGQEDSADLFYWVRTSRLGEGIAVRAIRIIAEWGFELIGYRRIELVIATENSASIRVAEKLGALREGFLRNRIFLHGELHDAVIYALTRDDASLSAPSSGESKKNNSLTAFGIAERR